MSILILQSIIVQRVFIFYYSFLFSDTYMSLHGYSAHLITFGNEQSIGFSELTILSLLFRPLPNNF